MMLNQATQQDETYRERSQAALLVCESHIKDFRRSRGFARRLCWGLEGLIILLSAITPVLILARDVPVVVQALPPAFAGVAAGILGAFSLKESWVRFAASQTALESARLRFLTTSPHADREESLAAFVAELDRIISDEILQWRGHYLAPSRNLPPVDAEQGREPPLVSDVAGANGNRTSPPEAIRLER